MDAIQKRSDELLADDTGDVFQSAAIPEGYLLKAGEGGVFKGASFKKRYFRLENNVLLYYKGKAIGKANGTIDMNQVSKVHLEETKGKCCLLVTTPSRVYTLSSDDPEILAQWSARLSREVTKGEGTATAATATTSKSKNKRGSVVGRRLSGLFGSGTIAVQPPGTIPAYEYKVIFQGGPLHMDLEADEEDRPTVLSFSKNSEGEKGPAEACGQIQIGDALVACNEDQLDRYDFTDAISVVVGQPWPRTMTFERPAAEPVPDAEGWLFKQGDSAKSALRRRMFKLYGSTLFYYKPSRLNAAKANGTPAGHILMKDVLSIKTYHDKTKTGNKQYRLELHTKNRVWLLCPTSVEGLTYWQPILSNSVQTPIPAGDLIVVEVGSGEQKGNDSGAKEGGEEEQELEDGLLVKEGVVRRKDFFGEARRPRFLQLHLNRLLFRPESKRDAVPYRIDVSDLTRAARLINTGAEAGQRDTVKLELKDGTSHEFMTTSTELAIEWINALRSLGGLRKKIKAGETIDLSTLNISKEETADETAAVETETATRERVNSQLTMDEMEQLAEGKEEREATKEETDKVVDHAKTSRSEGWLYKMGEAKMGFLGAYRKRWFSLQKDNLPYYKHRVSSNVNALLAAQITAGRIMFRHVIDVRQSQVSGCPDNTIEIVTPTRIYTLVPGDDEENDDVFDNWMKELRNASDIYGADYVEAQKLAKKEKEEEEKANQERIKHLKVNIVQCGMLGKKGKINPTMKSRYFALVGQSLSYYATEEDVYREDGDEIGSIDLGTVSELTYPTKDTNMAASNPYAFDMVSGERVWCLGAQNADNLEEWMRAIVQGTQKLEIQVVVEGGTKKITTTNPQVKLVNRLGHYGVKKKKVGKGGKGGKKKKGRGSVVAKQRRSSQKPLAGTLGSIADVGGGGGGEAKKHVKQDSQLLDVEEEEEDGGSKE